MVYVNIPRGTLERRGVGNYHRGARIVVATAAAVASVPAAAATTTIAAAAAAISFVGQVMVRYVTVTIVRFSPREDDDVARRRRTLLTSILRDNFFRIPVTHSVPNPRLFARESCVSSFADAVKFCFWR